MKRIFLIGTALLLMVLPLAGCGVAQEDLDDAIAERDAAEAQVSSLQSKVSAAESDLTAAESDLAAAESALATSESAKAAAESAKASADSAKATAVSAKAAAESDLAAAESDLAAAEAEIADLEAEIAALEAAAEEEVVEEEEEVVEEEEEVVEEEEEVVEEEEEAPAVTEVETSFEAAEYVNEDPAFSVKYPIDWTEEAGVSAFDLKVDAGEVYRAGIGAYGLPQVGIFVIDVADAATLEEAIIFATGDADMEIASSADATTADGTACTEALVYWILGSFPVDSWILVAQTDSQWIIVMASTVTMYFPIDEALAWEISRSLLLQ